MVGLRNALPTCGFCALEFIIINMYYIIGFNSSIRRANTPKYTDSLA